MSNLVYFIWEYILIITKIIKTSLVRAFNCSDKFILSRGTTWAEENNTEKFSNQKFQKNYKSKQFGRKETRI